MIRDLVPCSQQAGLGMGSGARGDTGRDVQERVVALPQALVLHCPCSATPAPCPAQPSRPAPGRGSLPTCGSIPSTPPRTLPTWVLAPSSHCPGILTPAPAPAPALAVPTPRCCSLPAGACPSRLAMPTGHIRFAWAVGGAVTAH